MNGYNFTERVRTALALAREEAAALRHDYVGTEHLLLGILREGGGVAGAMLEGMTVNLDALRDALIDTAKPGRGSLPAGDLPYTSRGKKTLELAMSEAREHQHSYVGTEHLLLGLVREEKGAAAQMLKRFGVEAENARAEMLHVLGNAAGDSSRTARPKRAKFRRYPKRLTEVLTASHDVAARHKSLEITCGHVVIAILEHGDGVANAALDRLGMDRPAMIAAVAATAPTGDATVGPEDVMLSSSTLLSALDFMEEDRRDSRAPSPGTHHLLLAILATSSEIAEAFATQNIDAARLRKEIRRIAG